MKVIDPPVSLVPPLDLSLDHKHDLPLDSPLNPPLDPKTCLPVLNRRLLILLLVILKLDFQVLKRRLLVPKSPWFLH